MSNIPTAEYFLDPYMLLDNFDWYDQSAAFFGHPDAQAVIWPESI